MPTQASLLVGDGPGIWSDGCATIGDVLERAVRGGRGGGVIRHIRGGNEGTTTETKAELLASARKVAGTLRTRGLSTGTRVLLRCDDTEAFLHGLWGALLAGLAPVPVGPVTSGKNSDWRDGLRQVAAGLGCELALVSSTPKAAVAECLDGLGVEVLPVEECETCGEPADPLRLSGDAIALVQPTSGTTSSQKFVKLTHDNILAVLRGTAELPLFQYSRSLSWMPLEHVGSLVWHLRNVLIDCEEESLAHPKLFLADPLRWLDWLSAYRVEMTRAANFGFVLVVRELEARSRRRWSLSSVRVCVNTAERVDPEVCAKFIDLLEPAGLRRGTIYPSYGMAELGSGVVYASAPCDPPNGVYRLARAGLAKGAVGSRYCPAGGFVEVGRPIRTVSVRVVDEVDAVVPEGTEGHIQAAGDTVSPGYVNGRAGPERFTKDGWFRTGDIGLVTDGKLVITGRAKDLVIVRGMKIVPQDIELVIGGLAGVDPGSVVVHQTTSERDQSVSIFFSPVVGRSEIPALVPEISAKVAEVFGFVPDKVLPVRPHEIPRTNTGKVVRRELERLIGTGPTDGPGVRAGGRTGSVDALPNWFARRTWVSQKLSGGIAGRARTRCVVFADTRGTATACGKQLVARGWELVWVYSGPEFSMRSSGVYEIDPTRESDYEKLLDALEGDGCDEVLHCWSLETVMATWGIDAFERAQDLGLYSILYLMRALAGRRQREARFTVVTAGAQVVAAGDGAEEFVGRATVNGLVVAAAGENAVQCRQVDLTEPVESDAMAASSVVDELLDARACEPVAAYRNGERLVPRLSPIDVDGAFRRPPFREDGLCLVTGGLGGIGSHLCRYLLETYGTGLVIVGRKQQAEAERSAVYRRLARAGELMYRTVSLGDEGALREVVACAEKRWRRRLSTVFHLAGVARDVPVPEETRTGVRTVFDGKVYGALTIGALTRERPDLAVVLFSSVAAVLPPVGRRGLSAYAAANSCLDYLAAAVRRNGGKAWSINWNGWTGVGMNKGRSSSFGRMMRTAPIGPKQGMESLAAVLRADEAQVVVGYEDGPGWRRATSGGRRASGTGRKQGRESAGVAEVREDGVQRSADENEVVRTSLRMKDVVDVWTEVFDGAEIREDTDFFGGGGDSVRAMKLVAELERRLEMEVGLAELIENPSPRKLWTSLRARRAGT